MDYNYLLAIFISSMLCISKCLKTTEKVSFNIASKASYVYILKITEKVSFNIASEASYVYILSGQK